MNVDDFASECDHSDLNVEIDRLRAEIEQHARVDYWAERYRDQERLVERLRAENVYLKESHAMDLDMIASLMAERDDLHEQLEHLLNELERLREELWEKNPYEAEP